MIILGIETSCDETSVALLNDKRKILAQHTFSQTAAHQIYGGVVPEVAARLHLQHLPDFTRDILKTANLQLADIDAIAATIGPGLMGGLLVGATYGRAMALAAGKQFIPVNHLEAHALTARLTHKVAFPYLLLLVSGGHTALIWVAGVGDYKQLGTTRDDAAGEAFDKTAKLMGLPWPGGPALETLAKQAANPKRFTLPRPMLGAAHCDFSFSGLKTAVRHAVITQNLQANDFPDLAAATQSAIADTLADRVSAALKMLNRPISTLVVAGGVAANQTVRTTLQGVADRTGAAFVAPPIALCTDNAAMIAWCALERLQAGCAMPANLPARPRWPLEQMSNQAENL